tara:strand:- start:17647 stop:18021 length:375 start_codon:yes stop_codon:yes gene_type:complete
MNATNPTSRLFLIASLALSLLTGSFTTPAFSATDSARKCCQPEARSTCCGMACCQTPIPQHDRTPLPNEKSSSGRDLAGFDSGLPAGRMANLTADLLRLRMAANAAVPVSGAPSLVALHVLLRV